MECTLSDIGSAASVVAVDVLVALTLLPAILGFAGRRILPPSARRSRPSTVRRSASPAPLRSASISRRNSPPRYRSTC
ncbi:MMPL family transporter [Nocardia vinacea]|uniref:MMPL family transporter n=1 Tax=Nocardia vinacea TaxID=96468 RepID=UPI0012F646FD|nr:MMPL family transporter [Nocardia vinacea]